MTFEEIYECTVCRKRRQFGCASSLHHSDPAQPYPRLRCSKCRTVTLHCYIGNRLRTSKQEDKVRAEFRFQDEEAPCSAPNSVN